MSLALDQMGLETPTGYRSLLCRREAGSHRDTPSLRFPISFKIHEFCVLLLPVSVYMHTSCFHSVGKPAF